jgi:CHAD domain-containing protein
MDSDNLKLKEIKPVLSGYIREAQVILGRSAIPDDRAVHDIRVLMKKSRAVLRLIRIQVDKETFQREYASFREVGRIMRSWRETSVHRKTLRELRKDYPGVFVKLQNNEQIEALMRKDVSAVLPSENIIRDIQKLNEILRKSEYRIRFYNMDGLIVLNLLTGLEETYNGVVNNYLTCRNSPKPAFLHEFRKRAKDFLYQLYFFRPLNPTAVKSLEKKLDNLTQNLGKYNDLVQLIKAIGYKYGANGNQPAMDQLAVIIRNWQDRYLMKVWPAAYKIFCPGKELTNILRLSIPAA